jgi:ATP-dependent Zn protease
MHNNKLFHTAIHEAAHAIASINFGRRFSTVTIQPHEDYNGVITYKEPNGILISKIDLGGDPVELEKEVKEFIVVTYAGYVAERLLGVENSEGARSDFETIIDIALAYCGDGDTASNFIEQCRIECETFLKSHWLRVQIVAEVLLECKTMTEEQVQSCLAKLDR